MDLYLAIALSIGIINLAAAVVVALHDARHANPHAEWQRSADQTTRRLS
jgi:hypothetical protein